MRGWGALSSSRRGCLVYFVESGAPQRLRSGPVTWGGSGVLHKEPTRWGTVAVNCNELGKSVPTCGHSRGGYPIAICCDAPPEVGERACLSCTQVRTAARYTSVPRPNRTNARLQGPSTQVSMVPQQDGENPSLQLVAIPSPEVGTAPFFAASSPFCHLWQKIRHTSILAVPFWHKPCAILA